MRAATGLESLERAIGERHPVTLSVDTGTGAVVEIVGKLLSGGEDDGIWIQTKPEDGRTLERWTTGKVSLQASFSDDDHLTTFETALEKRDRHYWINDQMMVDAVRVRWPEELASAEKRRAKRYRVGDSVGGVYGKLFTRDPSGVPKEVPHASLWDFGMGGASFVCSVDKKLMATQKGEGFVVVVQFRGQRIMLPARFTYARAFSSKTLRVGVQFDFCGATATAARGDLEKACGELDAEGK
jgi:hypothetical protein